MDWKKTERTSYLERLRKATMEELYAAENPESLGLVPDSVIRRQKAATITLDSGKSDLVHSFFNDSNFEESDLSEQNDPEESLVSSLSNLENDERLQHVSSCTGEADVWKGQIAVTSNQCMARASSCRWIKIFFRRKSIWKKGQITSWWMMEEKSNASVLTGRQLRYVLMPLVAVAKKEDEIASYLTWYGKIKCTKKRNLTSAANLNVKKSTLRNKGKRPKRKRSGQPPSTTFSKKNKSSATRNSINLNG